MEIDIFNELKKSNSNYTVQQRNRALDEGSVFIVERPF